MAAEGVRLTASEREALRTSGSWPNVGADIYAAVEGILTARLAKVEALLVPTFETAADETWGTNPRVGPIHPDDLRAALGDAATGATT